MNGKFISIEGIEGAGKSTQLQFIADYIRSHGKQVVVTPRARWHPFGRRNP